MTRTRTSLLTISGLVFGVAVFGSGCAELGSTVRTGKPTTQPTASTAPRDLQLLEALAQHARMGVALTELATDRASSDEVRSIAGHVRRDDWDELRRVQGLRVMWYGLRGGADGAGVPGAGAVTEQELDQLKSLSGEEFDRAFLEKMIEHHEAGLAMANEIVSSTERDRLKSLGNEIIQETQDELPMLREWRAGLATSGGSTGVGGGPVDRPDSKTERPSGDGLEDGVEVTPEGVDLYLPELLDPSGSSDAPAEPR